MSIAPWKPSLKKALHLNRSQAFSRYIQLATITHDGKPSNRTVVFRGFFNDSNTIQIITDTRSQKFSHLQHQPWVEICWYFCKTREQFRLSGEVILVTAENPLTELIKARYNSWQNLSDASKKQFFWETPGELITQINSKELSKIENSDNSTIAEKQKSHGITHDLDSIINDRNIGINDEIAPPTNFCLLLVNPEQVDHLQLKGERHNRFLYILNSDQTWSIEQVNP